jgi:hypothetical protein
VSARLRAAVELFHTTGTFTEDDYGALQAALAPAAARSTSQTFDGLVGLFFERHLMNDRRRTELLAMTDDELGRAVRYRFRQLMADQHEGHRAYHALRPYVAEALQALQGRTDEVVSFPVTIQGRTGFSAVAIEQAVAALWAEVRIKPTVAEATGELLKRYVRDVPNEPVTESREFPEVVRARLDAQRLARGMLNVLSIEERDLLRAVLDGVPVEDWAEANDFSRASAYRLYARLKALCELELKDRSHGTKLAAIDALRGQLKPENEQRSS